MRGQQKARSVTICRPWACLRNYPTPRRDVVKEVSFENRAGLTADQLSTLRKLVIGRCYHPANAMFISERMYEQLRLWGYCEATVYDPNRFRVLDPSPQPSPIAVVVDFRLTGTDAHPK